MDSISKADRFVALLRLKLADRARAQAGRTAASRAPSQKGAEVPAGETVARTARAGADDRMLGRAIVEQLLGERLGHQLANEPRFQQVVERVMDAIDDDRQLGAMLAEVMAEIRRAK